MIRWPGGGRRHASADPSSPHLMTYAGRSRPLREREGRTLERRRIKSSVADSVARGPRLAEPKFPGNDGCGGCTVHLQLQLWWLVINWSRAGPRIDNTPKRERNQRSREQRWRCYLLADYYNNIVIIIYLLRFDIAILHIIGYILYYLLYGLCYSLNHTMYQNIK